MTRNLLSLASACQMVTGRDSFLIAAGVIWSVWLVFTFLRDRARGEVYWA